MEILAACDVDEGRLQTGLDRIGTPVAAHKDYQKLLSMSDINAVLICTPNMFHKEMVIASLEAGKHVMCEKPMAVSWEECEAMRQAEERSPNVVLYTLQLRYSYRYQEFTGLVTNGKIGAPQYVFLPEYRGDWNLGNVWNYADQKTGREMNWRFSQLATGGTLNEKMCHYFDITNWIFNDVPTKVMCGGGIVHYKNPERQTWDHASVHLEYPSGAKALVSLCMFAPKRLDPQVIGEEGSLYLQSDSVLFQGTGTKSKEREEIALTQEIGHGQKGGETAVSRMYNDFLDCVENRKKPFVGIETAMRASKIAWLAELSSQRKSVVSWNDL